jgi:hypothetical protein
MTRDDSNAAQVRGDIQRGRTGDKRSGFDPALAPMETDAEAGGTPLTPDQVEIARNTQLRGVRDRSGPEYSTAMGYLPGLPSPPRAKPYWLVAAAAGAVLVSIAVVVYLLGGL